MRRIVLVVSGLLVLTSLAFAEDAPTAAQALLRKGDGLFQARDYAGATAAYLEAVTAAERAGEAEALVEALAMAARGHLIREEGAAGRPYLERAGQLVQEDMPQGWSRYLGVLGRFQWKDGDNPAATRTFERMYAYCMQHDLHGRAIDAAHMVAITGTKEQQVAWAHRGIAAAEKGGMDGWLGPLWNNLGVTHHERGDEEQALAAYRKAREYHWKVGSEVNKLAADWAVGMTLRRLARLTEAKTWLRPVLAWAERRYAEERTPERGEWVGLALLELGLVARAEGDAWAARTALEPARAHLKAVDMAAWDPAAWKDLEEALDAVRRETRGDARTSSLAQAALRSIGAAIEAYRLAHKELPPHLDALTGRDGATPGGFLAEVPDDPWGNAYEYRVLDRATWQVRSRGPDGVADTADDLVHP